MQALLACKYFEELARSPLKLETVFEKRKNLETDKWERFERSETEAEFQDRKDVQKAIIDVIDSKKAKDPKRMENSLKALHQKLQPKTVGKPGNAYNFTCEIFAALGKNVTDDHAVGSYLFNRSQQLTIDFREESLKNRAEAPKMIVAHFETAAKIENLDAIIDLTRFWPDGKYRIVGVKHSVKSHDISYVSQNSRWYKCDDDKVSTFAKRSLTILNHEDDFAILEKIESI